MENSPTRSGSSETEWRTFVSLTAEARKICAACPLWAECLQDAVLYADTDGYVAATTPADRRWMRRRLGVGERDGTLSAPESEHSALNEVLAERRRSPDASQREMAVRLGCSRSTVARRLASARAQADQAARERTASRPEPGLDAVLDAFDALQDRLSRDSGIAVGVGACSDVRQPRAQPCERPTRVLAAIPKQSRGGSTRTPAPLPPESAEAISVSLNDPALAVRKAILWPLIGSAEPALAGVEQLALMLAAAPESTMTPETVRQISRARHVLRRMVPSEAARPATGLDLTGTVSVAAAKADPVAALQRAFLEPLVVDLVAVLARVETVMTMLSRVSVPGATASDIATVKEARETLEAQLSLARGRRPAPEAPRAPEAETERPEHPTALASRTSIRIAVEKVVRTFTEPFTVKDVLRALVDRLGYAPVLYRDLGKSVSNVLSIMVGTGKVTRVARGTYLRVDSAEKPSADSPSSEGAAHHD
ncbi:WhiB family transcriptional regulator [Streptomyces sp. NPDC057702]|uniref:WhiB family transcriptional regulator n=1 Tax=unclassified Streptomyces TaxID=2593676 RepID=UPI0036C9408D